ncbi:30S ribosomal protein S12 methylthiotransferase RimO [Acidothermaceae bacterium B102]|nr:30S ribosomal protein S12 methylthiotransferase RimO [Acidothermaceae bacterium B102]
MSTPVLPSRRFAVVTLGCARNETDSEELAGRLADEGWLLVDDAADADAVLVNTCGFIEAAKKDSVDTLLAAAELKSDLHQIGSSAPQAVVAVGCLAERYGEQLAEALPEADAVLGFDQYADIAARLEDVLAGRKVASHTPRDRRTLLPITPVDRASSVRAVPGHAPAHAVSDLPDLPLGLAPASGPRPVRRRLGSGPAAPLKIASGCDRRCAFCAIPSFRGSFISRRPSDVIAEAHWLAEQGVRELVLVSENSTSYGKDLGDLRLLETVLPELAAVPGVARVRLSYLQPAEMRPSLIDVMTSTPGVVPYFDLSFQHSSATLLRRMRRFGDTDRFLELVASIRERSPEAGIRSNVIVGFPGERKADVAELERFLTGARLDAVGVFGYSDEDGTEALSLDGKVSAATIARRLARVGALVEELSSQRAEERIGTQVEVLVESLGHDGSAEGRAEHQAPEVDGSTALEPRPGRPYTVGELVTATVVSTVGVDLVASAVELVGARVG